MKGYFIEDNVQLDLFALYGIRELSFEELLQINGGRMRSKSRCSSSPSGSSSSTPPIVKMGSGQKTKRFARMRTLPWSTCGEVAANMH